MITKRVSLIHQPLALSRGIEIIGTTPNRQTYDVNTGETAPDFTIAPLVLQPWVRVSDKGNSRSQVGNVTRYLTSVKWYEQVGYGATKTLLQSQTHVSISTTLDDTLGRLSYSKNSQPKVPITLTFAAQYLDSATGQTHEIQCSVQIRCVQSATKPRVLIDAPDSATLYNPLRSADKQVIKAKALLGGEEIAAAKRLFVWEVLEDDEWREIGTDLLDYNFEISSDGSALTIDRTKMGEQCSVRVRLKYDVNGSPSSVTLDDTSPCAQTSVERRIPGLEYFEAGVSEIPADSDTFSPKAIVRDNVGVVSGKLSELSINWYGVQNKETLSLKPSATTMTKLADGQEPTIKTSLFSQDYGMVLGLDVQDRGSWCAWADSDGSVITDSDGAILLIR